MEPIALFCARCSAELAPGSGGFYHVNIEAFADPAPPDSADENLEPDAIRRRLAQLYEQLEDTTAQEAMDQVYRHMTFHLCARCYRSWIENPAG